MTQLLMLRALTFALAVACAGAVAGGGKAADPWPNHPVKIVVPFSASGTADLLARLVADRLGASLGQAFILDHRPGAGGIIGDEQVARAAPDGYTFVVSSLGSFVISPVFTPVNVEPFKDFTHIAYLGGQPLILSTSKDAPYRTLAELVSYAKANPGAVTYATIAAGSQGHLINVQFEQHAGIRMTHVPYRGAGQIVTDVLGGHIGAGLTALTVAEGQLAAGALRGLAISASERVPELPEVPTYAELGYPDLVASAWFALSGPAKLPRGIAERLNAEVVKALHAPDIEARLRKETIDTKSLDPSAFTEFFKAEAQRWTPWAKAVAAQMKASGAQQ
jgi:tripartite-type tricarboxylate transporter receptor subunit TctC